MRNAIWKRIIFISFWGFFLFQQSCGSASDAAARLICGDGHAKGKMTVGLNFDFLKDALNLTEDDSDVSDSDLKDYLNDGLNKVGIDSAHLNVDKVESLSKNDEFRFMELGGTFGSGFGVATKLITDAFTSRSLANEGPFSFINESFGVAAAAYSIVETKSPHPDQWAYKQTDFDGAVATIKSIRENNPKADNKPIIVAVLDTGVDSNHPDLKEVMLPGADFSDSGSGSDDENGHGTHCAGIIAGQAKQANTGMLGVAQSANVKILPIKVLGKDGGGGFQAIEKGVRYATEQGADVISMSLGAGLEYSELKKQGSAPLNNKIIKAAIDKGIIVVVAAGNEACKLGGECKGQGFLSFPKTYNEYTVVPCAYEDVICVGASNADETLADYSNYSSAKKSNVYRTKADINAPGTAIYSTWPQSLGKDYNTISGTSMATPYVAGVAALFKWADRSITQAQFLELLNRGQAKPKQIVEKSGVGRLDLYAASVALANDRKVPGAPTEKIPDPNKVEAPDTGDGNDGDGLVSNLFKAVCN